MIMKMQIRRIRNVFNRQVRVNKQGIYFGGQVHTINIKHNKCYNNYIIIIKFAY